MVRSCSFPLVWFFRALVLGLVTVYAPLFFEVQNNNLNPKRHGQEYPNTTTRKQ